MGDIFARKVTQIPKSQNRFRIGANLKFFGPDALPNLLLNANFLGHFEKLNAFKHTVLVTKGPSFRKPRSICAIDQKIISHFWKIDRKMTFATSI